MFESYRHVRPSSRVAVKKNREVCDAGTRIMKFTAGARVASVFRGDASENTRRRGERYWLRKRERRLHFRK